MSTPAQNIQTLRSYWQNSGTPTGPIYLPQALGEYLNAQVAMTELCDQAASDAGVRAQFANAAVFETAMINDQLATAEIIMREGGAFRASSAPPRQIMLDAIIAASTGGWWKDTDPSGVTSWLRSVDVAAGAFVGNMKTDPVAEVRAAGLRLVTDVAIPEFWLTFFKSQQLFESVEESLKTSSAPVATRMVLRALSASAQGRVERDLAKLPSFGQLAQFPTGDGSQAATVPAPRKPWYRDGRTLATGTFGLLIGAFVANRPQSR